MTPRQRFTQALTLDVSAMSFGRLITILSGLLVIAAVLGGSARWVSRIETKTHADSLYVRRDTFAIHQAGEALVHRTDSLIQDARAARMDSALAALLRACRHKGECS